MEKKKYTTPELHLVEIDMEISLSLESPPAGPEEGFNTISTTISKDPYKSIG